MLTSCMQLSIDGACGESGKEMQPINVYMIDNSGDDAKSVQEIVKEVTELGKLAGGLQ